MIATDRDALICDFAETYHVFNFFDLPVETAAVLAYGLRDNSRIKMKLSNQRVSTETMLQAAAVDALNLLVWAKTKDAKTGRNRPKSLLQIFTGENEPEFQAFDNAADFEAARRSLLNRG